MMHMAALSTKTLQEAHPKMMIGRRLKLRMEMKVIMVFKIWLTRKRNPLRGSARLRTRKEISLNADERWWA
jgi:hypothetical protein